MWVPITVRQINQSITRTIIQYANSNFFKQALGVVTAVIRPKLLTPELFGLWSIFKLIPTYASYSHLGARSSMFYRIPNYNAQGQIDKSTQTKINTFYGTLGINLLLALALVVTALLPIWSIETHASPVPMSLLLLAAIVMVNWYFEYSITVHKAEQRFDVVSASNYVRAGSYFIFTLALILGFGLNGALLALLLSLILTSLFLESRAHLPALKGQFQFSFFLELIREGFPIVAFNLGILLIRTSDRILVGLILGATQLGYYAVAAMVLGFVMNVPGVSREVIEPKLMQEISSASQKKVLNTYLLKPLLTTAMLMPMCIGPTYILLPVVVDSLLPDYREGIEAAQLLVMGGYFLALSFPLRGIIVAYQWQVQASYIVGLSLSTNIGLNLMLLHTGYGIKGVALASIFSFIILFAGLITCLFFKLGRATFVALRPKLCLGLFPFPVTCLMLYVLLQSGNALGLGVYLTASLQLIVLTGVFAPLVFVVQRNNYFLPKAY